MIQSPLDQREVLSVSALNTLVQQQLESLFPLIWLQGELSNLSMASSGHWYFSLKDSKAQVRCALFKNRNQYIRFVPKNGDQVLVRARLSVYTPRGEYQLIIEHMEPAGLGQRQQDFDRLKAALQAEGLLDSARKQIPPPYPRRIGVITSPVGAAIQDVISVLARRYPIAKILIYPVQVQGRTATTEIVNMLALANQRQDCDVLLLIRGGGSIEDLWVFNEAPIARAIAASTLPIVTGIGHESDTTIADLVADYRAPTPSVAAEIVSPDQTALQLKLLNWKKCIHEVVSSTVDLYQRQISHLSRHLQKQHPKRQLQQQRTLVQHRQLQLQRSIETCINRQSYRLDQRALTLSQHRPDAQLKAKQEQLDKLVQRLYHRVSDSRESTRQRIALASCRLQNLSPLNTLARGYAIVSAERTQKIVKHCNDVSHGDTLSIRLAEGKLLAEVK